MSLKTIQEVKERTRDLDLGSHVLRSNCWNCENEWTLCRRAYREEQSAEHSILACMHPHVGGIAVGDRTKQGKEKGCLRFGREPKQSKVLEVK